MGMLQRPKGATRNRKRLGRGPGSGNGTTAGKGTKGQNSRSGGGVRPGFEGGQMPLYRRIARRGFSNYPFKKAWTVVGLDLLEKVFVDGDAVTMESLRERRVIGASDDLVKILANGTITKKITVSGMNVSKAAQAMIEAAGGSVEAVEVGAPVVSRKRRKRRAAKNEKIRSSAASANDEGDDK